MDREQLKKESPDLYNALVNESYEAGMKAERERVNALKSLAATDPDNEKLQEVVSEAVENGASAQDSTLLTKINVAIRDGKKLEGENPPAVATESADADSEDNGAQAMIDKLKKLA